jgi:hypothetical protein
VHQKNLATGKASTSKTADAGGFMLYHLIIMIVLGILFGAFFKTKFMTSAPEVVNADL